MEKIFILSNSTNKDFRESIANKIAKQLDGDLAVEYSNNKEPLMPIDDIDIAYKNNSLLYCETIDEFNTVCIPLDEFYNKDIFSVSISQYNNISESILNAYDVLLVWLDCECSKCTKKEIIESNVFENSLQISNYPLLYFNNEDEDNIVNTICNYVNGTDIERNEILFENS